MRFKIITLSRQLLTRCGITGVLLLVLLLLCSVATLAYDPTTIRDMPFVNSSKYCLECHTRTEAQSFENRLTKSCNVYCETCHQDLGAHHKVDQVLEGKTPGDLELLNGRMACFTCHDLDTPRYDSVSWKAESLYESLFSSKKVYRTYFLTIRNNEGKLCKQCH